MPVIERPEIDKRLFERIPVAVSLHGTDLASGLEFQGYTHDVSGRGIGLISDRELLPGMPLQLVIRAPDGGEPLCVRGKVSWSRITESFQCRAGVVFDDVDLMGMSRILRAFDHLD